MQDKARYLFYRHFEEKYIFSSLTTVFFNNIPRDRETVFLCIGAERSTGDSFGPMTGTLLKQMKVNNVFGTLENPVHAQNLTEIYNSIEKGKFTVAIDASLGSFGELGFLKVKKGPIHPGSATGKDLPPVGDLSVVLNVGIGGIANYLLLQTASLNMVWKGANIVARSVSTALYMIKKGFSFKNSLDYKI
ncbi:MAG: spore protease YyaC [Pelotomaculum sp.]|nr:spore protease YyaC [Pelotomaculum sp.]